MAHSASHPLAEGGFVSPALSQRAVMFAAIVALHVVLVYLFASGLAASTINVVFGKTDVTFLDEPQEANDPPPPPNVELYQPKIDDFGPIPDPMPGEDHDTGTALTLPPTVATPPVAQPVAPRVEPIHLVGKHQLPNTEDYYPPSLIRENVQGATSISVCVDERGKRTGEPTVIDSSGDARLDKAALAVGRDGRYARSARGETFVPNCYGFKIVFKVK
jgi:Gram-negative bacterial TonB protein C-terminal